MQRPDGESGEHKASLFLWGYRCFFIYFPPVFSAIYFPRKEMCIRDSYYEGYSMADVVLPIRVMGMLGAKKVILTNAAGGVNFDYHPGDLMLITDHITTAVPSPLIGANIDQLGSRFPDMSEVYLSLIHIWMRQPLGMKEQIHLVIFWRKWRRLRFQIFKNWDL